MEGRKKGYLLLAVGIAIEVVGATMMKMSSGFTVIWATALFIIAYVVVYSLFPKILRVLPLGFMYAVWSGAGTALTALVGVVLWGEPLNFAVIAGIAAVIAGIALLQLSSDDATQEQKACCFDEMPPDSPRV